MPHLEAASRISMPTVVSSSKTLVSGLAQLAEEVQLLRRAQNSPPGDRFVAVMEAFLEHATPSIAALQATTDQLTADMKRLVAYFGMDITTCKPEDIFSTLATFKTSFLQAADEVAASPTILEVPAENPVKPTTPNGIASRSPSTPVRAHQRYGSQASTAGKRSVGKGGLDLAIRDLRTGSGLRRQRTQRGARPLSRVFLTE